MWYYKLYLLDYSKQSSDIHFHQLDSKGKAKVNMEMASQIFVPKQIYGHNAFLIG